MYVNRMCSVCVRFVCVRVRVYVLIRCEGIVRCACVCEQIVWCMQCVSSVWVSV